MCGSGDKKGRIIGAAMEIFSERPYHQVKIGEIAQKAGVGKGTIYEYFSSKEELFAAMIEAGFQAYFAAIVSAVSAEPTARGKLRAVFFSHLSFIGRHAPAARLLMGERRAPHPGVREAMVGRYRLMARFIEELLRQGVSSGEFREVDAGVVAHVIMGTLSALMVSILVEEGRTPGETEKAVEKLFDFYLFGLAGA